MGTVIGIGVILALLIGFSIWLYKKGGKDNEAKHLKEEAAGQDEADERGEEWEGAGGLTDIVKRRLSNNSKD